MFVLKEGKTLKNHFYTKKIIFLVLDPPKDLERFNKYYLKSTDKSIRNSFRFLSNFKLII